MELQQNDRVIADCKESGWDIAEHFVKIIKALKLSNKDPIHLYGEKALHFRTMNFRVHMKWKHNQHINESVLEANIENNPAPVKYLKTYEAGELTLNIAVKFFWQIIDYILQKSKEQIQKNLEWAHFYGGDFGKDFVVVGIRPDYCVQYQITSYYTYEEARKYLQDTYWGYELERGFASIHQISNPKFSAYKKSNIPRHCLAKYRKN